MMPQKPPTKSPQPMPAPTIKHRTADKHGWRPLLCRLGLHRWRWRKVLHQYQYTFATGEFYCERCPAIRES